MASVIDSTLPRTTSLESRASCCSRWTLSWFTDLIVKGKSKILTDEDLGPLSNGDDSLTSYNRLMKLWNEEVQAKGMEEANLFSVWKRMVGYRTFCKMILWALIDFGCQVSTPLMSRLVIQHVEGSITLTSNELIYLTIGLTMAPITAGFWRGQMILLAKRRSLQVYAGLTTAVYRKTMRLSASGRATVETGQVINMLSSDANNAMERAVFSIIPLLVAPPVVITILILLHGVIGNAMFAGFGFMLFSMPMNFNIFTKIVKYYKLIVGRADERVKLFNELITGIRIVKFYSWESPFKKLIDAARKSELKAIALHAVWMQCGMMVVFMQMSNFMQLTTFTTFSLTGGLFSASNIFTAMQLFGVLRGPVSQFPSSLSQLASLLVATKRLGAYLKRDERKVSQGDVFLQEKATDINLPSVEMNNCTFQWSKIKIQKKQGKDKKVSSRDSVKPIETEMTQEITAKNIILEEKKEEDQPQSNSFSLSNVNFKIMPGELCMVVGLVGCGKSSLLSSMLNEMPKEKGTIKVRGKTSIIQQNAWITNNTLKENLLFGEKYNKERYQNVVSACSLEADIRNFQGGDQIMIGERGINLSGGQKTRVGLARACYSRSDIVLLDCPLAAVDSHVADHIFNQCILKLLKSRTRIFATNQIQRLEHADKIIILKKGVVVACGTWNEISTNYTQELELLGREATATSSSSSGDDGEEENGDKMSDENAATSENNNDTGKSTLRLRTSSISSITSSEGRSSSHTRTRSRSKSKDNALRTVSKDSNAPNTLIQAEERQIGHVSADVWKYFFRSGGWCFSISAILCLTFFTYVQVAVSFVLSEWCNEVSLRVITNSTNDPDGKIALIHTTRDRFWLTGYGSTMGFALLVMLLGGYLMARLRVRVATKLHDDMLTRILRAPISFFDITPVGRIMNRFSKEQNSVDFMLTVMIGFLFVTLNTTFAAMIAISIASYGILAILFVPLAIFFYYVSGWIRHTSIEVQRLEAVHRSPLYAASTEILGGVDTIRAFGQVERFEETYRKHLDRQMVPFFFARSVLFAWMMIRINALTSLIVLAIMISLLMFPDLFPPGNMALCLTWGLSVTEMMLHVVNLSIEAEIQMNAVERIKNYAEDLPQEKPMICDDTMPPTSWPEQGSLTFDQISAGYRDGPDVLKSITFHIKPSEKIGIVGRTGSGKSTLLTLLFRIVEPRTGTVTIDGIDTATLGLQQLRRNLGIIPQTPVMFSGTLRKNIDPFSMYSDEKLWDVLKQVNLHDTVQKLLIGKNVDDNEKGGEKLDYQVSEGGSNFSVGQRQLLCMARALLLDPKILLLDEATAQIDQVTDSLLQTMIREKFSNKTVLTIAHRLETIMDSDRILVLDNGKIAQFDTPEELLKDTSQETGLFWSLIHAEGEENAIRLENMIRKI